MGVRLVPEICSAGSIPEGIFEDACEHDSCIS